MSLSQKLYDEGYFGEEVRVTRVVPQDRCQPCAQGWMPDTGMRHVCADCLWAYIQQLLGEADETT